jgi:adenylate cyclase
MAPNGNREELRALLRRYNEQPEQRTQNVAEIEARFQRPAAILVLDSSGFTRSVRRNGIIHFLALLERMERTVRPIIAAHRGRVLRVEGDNIFAVFPVAADAVTAAAGIMQVLRAVNEALPSQDEVGVSIGIGYGQVLLVGDDDVFGDEMNLACKLGEDLAQRDEILLTPQAHAALGESPWPVSVESYSVSGIEVTAFRLHWTQD